VSQFEKIVVTELRKENKMCCSTGSGDVQFLPHELARYMALRTHLVGLDGCSLYCGLRSLLWGEEDV